MTNIKDLQVVKNIIDDVITDLKENPEHSTMIELLDALAVIEDHYQEFCAGCDEDFNYPKGDSYENGIHLEYYIESSWWHDVSKQLRILRPRVDELTDE